MFLAKIVAVVAVASVLWLGSPQAVAAWVDEDSSDITNCYDEYSSKEAQDSCIDQALDAREDGQRLNAIFILVILGAVLLGGVAWYGTASTPPK